MLANKDQSRGMRALATWRRACEIVAFLEVGGLHYR
jgi:hypothetical protein